VHYFTCNISERPIVSLPNACEYGPFNYVLLALVIGVFSSSVGNGNYGSCKVGINQTCGFLSIAGRVIFQVVAVFLGFGTVGVARGFFGPIAGGIVG